MTKTSRKFVHHYAGVAIFVGLLSSFGTWTATRFVTASSAQPAPTAAKPLLVQPLADLPGREVRITRPLIITPDNMHPEFRNFFENGEEGMLADFIMARTAAFSHLQFENQHGPARIVTELGAIAATVPLAVFKSWARTVAVGPAKPTATTRASKERLMSASMGVREA